MKSKPVIICVDDEKTVLSTLEEQLLSSLEDEFDIEIASSGDEALILFKELEEEGQKVATIISDQIMPGLKGDELLIKIHETDPEIPKILLTGQASLIAIQNAINKANLYRYISKPWEMNDLILTVKQAAKSFLAKQQIASANEQIETSNENIKVLKKVNISTRKLSAIVDMKQLADSYSSIVLNDVGVERCLIFDSKKDKLYILHGEDKTNNEKLQEQIKSNSKELIEKYKNYLDPTKDFKEGDSIAFLPLSSKNRFFGFALIANENRESISESQFELFKIITKQLAVSHETAKLYSDIETQRRLIEIRNTNISNSIDYAKKIQTALQPSTVEIEDTFADYFVWNKPKDSVSGDFYSFIDTGNHFFTVCSDCTGHGVPGALMTIIGRMAIRELVLSNGVTDPAILLERLDQRIIDLFHKYGVSDIRDGMDISIAVYNKVSKKMSFSGAKSNALLIKDKELYRVRGAKYEIGDIASNNLTEKYQSIDLDLKQGDKLYLFTDGYQDQFGGDNKKKLGLKKMCDLIFSSQDESMAQQKAILENFYNEWKGKNHQIDDIQLIGITI
ncbi:MAG: SpoIIE family protein phosphatase [Cyclobacteriaceae bacterium]